jgi:hypothetical protein
MFFNLRSAILQLTSATNFLDFDVNNPLAAMKAMADVKQYAEDFAFLINHPKLIERRNGLKADVTSSEIAAASQGPGNKVLQAISLLLKKGFLPTQAADSVAICFLGATYYRNRINYYIKEYSKNVPSGKLTEDALEAITRKAEKAAFADFSRKIEKFPVFCSKLSVPTKKDKPITSS